MKTFLKTLSYAIILILLAGIISLPVSKSAYANNQDKTIFVVSPTMIMATDNGVYMFDSSDNNIKLLSQDSTQSKTYLVGEILDGYACEDKIYFLTSSSLVVFDTNSQQFETFDLDWLENNDYKYISASKIDDTIYLCIYSNTVEVPVKYGYKQGNSWVFEHIINITTNQLNPETGIHELKLIQFDSNIYLARAYSQSLTFYQVTLDSDIDTTVNVVFDLSANADDGNIFAINWYSNNVLIITYEQITYFYVLDALASNTATKYAKTHNYNDDGFQIASTSINGNNFYLLSNDCYYFLNLLNIAEIGEFQQIGNTTCNIEYIENKQQFKYYMVSADSELIGTLGQTQSITVEQGKYVAEIANVTIQDGTALVGYKYVLYLKYYQDANQNWQSINVYGYIESENLTEIELTQQTSTIKVDNQTCMYSLPSIKVDSYENEQDNLNKVEYTINKNMPVRLLYTFDQYKTGYQQNTTDYYSHYALVQVGNYVGFIDMARIVSPDQRENRILSNATVIKKSYVYADANMDSTIIYLLNENTQITILESRDANGFAKIGFYDKNNNYFEGYMLYNNIHSFNYTILQIIGTLLVTINVILLVFLIYTKKKIVKQ